MYIHQLLSLAVLFSSTVLGSPHPTSANHTDLERRVSYNCGGYSYSISQTQAAWDDGIDRWRNNNLIAWKSRKYPGKFDNGIRKNNKIPELDASPCNGLTLYEWPIMQNGNAYNGGPPLTDRIVFGASSTTPGTYQQCFLMTHTGTGGNLFLKCD